MAGLVRTPLDDRALDRFAAVVILTWFVEE
jgi:hypothetical protein